jgi:hypothetical protein
MKISIEQPSPFQLECSLGLGSCIFGEAPPLLPSHLSLRAKLTIMILASLILWALFALLIIFLLEALYKELGIPIEIIGIIGEFLLLTIGLLVIHIKPLPAPKGSNKVKTQILLLRGFWAGSAIFFSIIFSQFSYIAAGMLSVFPAIFITTMISLWLSQGNAVSSGAAGPMMLGSSAVAGYAIFFGIFEPYFETTMNQGESIALSAILSYILSISLISLPVFFIIRRRYKQYERESVKQELIEPQLEPQLEPNESDLPVLGNSEEMK